MTTPQETHDTSIMLYLAAMTEDTDNLEKSLKRLFRLTAPLRKDPADIPDTASGIRDFSPETTSPADAKLIFLIRTIDRMRQRVDAITDSFLD